MKILKIVIDGFSFPSDFTTVKNYHRFYVRQKITVVVDHFSCGETKQVVSYDVGDNGSTYELWKQHRWSATVKQIFGTIVEWWTMNSAKGADQGWHNGMTNERSRKTVAEWCSRTVAWWATMVVADDGIVVVFGESRLVQE